MPVACREELRGIVGEDRDLFGSIGGYGVAVIRWKTATYAGLHAESQVEIIRPRVG